MNRIISVMALCAAINIAAEAAGTLSGEILLKNPGGNTQSYALTVGNDGSISLPDGGGLAINGKATHTDAGNLDIEMTLTATRTVYFNMGMNYT
ncbi:MAG: hypothetical protein K2L90_07235, partial [Muribaculaceae bacterium]|nr:hypothetical protein [Muribaculaceae bacterium]